MSMVLGPCKNPCGSCPYRKDVPSGVWDESEYDKLPSYDGATFTQSFALFLCHQQDGHLCAGWVGCHDMNETMAMRLAHHRMNDAEIDKTFDYVCPVPLWESGQAARDHGMAELEHPTAKAIRVIDKLSSRPRR